MRITRTRVCLAGLVCAIGLAFVPLNAAEEGRASDQLVLVVYSVSDLPVWSVNSKDGGKPEFNPLMLGLLVKSVVAPETWGVDRGLISPHEPTNSIVVRQTQENHDKIAVLLESLQPDRDEARLSDEDARR